MIKIVSDGTTVGTHFYNEDDIEIKNIVSFSIFGSAQTEVLKLTLLIIESNLDIEIKEQNNVEIYKVNNEELFNGKENN
jgi:hypothetical protein